MNSSLAILKLATVRTLVAVIAIGSLAHAAPARAQTKPPGTVAEPTIAPSQIFESLTNHDLAPGQRGAAALEALGVDASEFEGVRLSYDDLDGDGNAEALFTVALSGSNVKLVILKRKGEQWYRLPSPPEFSCWCKYEDSPLDTFVQIQSWPYWASGISKKDEPVRLLFVRGSGGGTGIYDRGLNVYALRGFVLTQVFAVAEEHRECGWTDGNCNLHHVQVMIIHEPNVPAALLAASYDRRVSADHFNQDTWWIGLPVRECKAYTWSTQLQKFAESPAATAAYCSHLGVRATGSAR